MASTLSGIVVEDAANVAVSEVVPACACGERGGYALHGGLMTVCMRVSLRMRLESEFQGLTFAGKMRFRVQGSPLPAG